MPPTKKPSSKEQTIMRSVKSLDDSIAELPKAFAYILQPWKRFLLSVMQGIGYGLGIIIAFAIVIPLLALLLQSIDWVPLIGDLFVQVSERIESVQQP